MIEDRAFSPNNKSFNSKMQTDKYPPMINVGMNTFQENVTTPQSPIYFKQDVMNKT